MFWDHVDHVRARLKHWEDLTRRSFPTYTHLGTPPYGQMATISLPGRRFQSTLLLLPLLLLLLHAANAFPVTLYTHHSPTTRRLAAATTTAVESNKPARPMIDPTTLPAPALKQKILQLAAQMDRGKLGVGCGVIWVLCSSA